MLAEHLHTHAYDPTSATRLLDLVEDLVAWSPGSWRVEREAQTRKTAERESGPISMDRVTTMLYVYESSPLPC